MSNTELSNRKTDHIELAFQAQLQSNDARFDYEPMLQPHPVAGSLPALQLAGKIMKAPLWISSMTGGAEKAGKINHNLAKACKEFGLGMGLGSCRPLLGSNDYLSDFAVRPLIGDQPLFANLGIAQVEEMLMSGQTQQIIELVKKLDADGLILHINPLQEWMQPEGDKLSQSPLETLKRLLDAVQFPIIVKEVGQGFGPKSLRELVQLPLEAIEYGAQGGTNFSLLESLRQNEFFRDQFEPVAHLGHSALDMTRTVNHLLEDPTITVRTRGFIVSGGIRNFLDGYYHLRSIPWKTMYAQASAFLKYALEGEEALFQFTEAQIKGLEMAWQYLNIRNTP